MSYDTGSSVVVEMGLKSKKVASNEVRIPTPERGTAVHVTRYSKDQSVILHPDDFDELQALDGLIERACRLKPLELSEAALRAHFEEDRSAGEAIEDAATLRKLFG